MNERFKRKWIDILSGSLLTHLIIKTCVLATKSGVHVSCLFICNLVRVLRSVLLSERGIVEKVTMNLMCFLMRCFSEHMRLTFS